MSRFIARPLTGFAARTLLNRPALSTLSVSPPKRPSMANVQTASYSTRKTTKSINPADGTVYAEFEYDTDEAAKAKVEQAHKAFGAWRKTPFSERAELFKKAGQILLARKAEFGELMCKEMGKTISEAVAEVEKCALVCDYYAEKAEEYLSPEHIETGFTKSYVTFNPLGVILIVMPWNYPFWQVFRQAACGVSAGNTMILKHASNVFGSAAAIESVFIEAGFPKGVFTNVPISGGQCSAVLEHPAVRAVALTGSTPVGKNIGAHAGRLLKKAVLELGGADPYIVLADADVDMAVEKCTAGRLLNCGQSCVGAKRFIIHESVYNEFVSKFKAAFMSKKQGDPMDPTTQIGPMVDVKSRDEVHKQVTDSIAQGATLVLGGEVPSGPPGSAFYPPTILGDCKPGIRAYHEEIFGPVATCIKVSSTDEAVFVANDSPFGLGSAIFSANVKEAERIAAEELEAGMAYVNEQVKSDPRLPFGGCKESGMGRECSHYGIKEFVNIKTVVIQ